MNGVTYRFRVGGFECMAVSDGTFTYAPPMFPPPGVFLFSNAPADSLGRALDQHNIQPEKWVDWTSPYICLVVQTGKHLVLVDTGAGNLAPSTGGLLRNLRNERIMPEDIDNVIITHGHPDHLGGNTDAEGRPAFPNARYVIWKDEWDFWTSGQAERTLDEHSREILTKFARANLPPLESRIDLVDSEDEIVPGIRTIAAPGHTPGHMALAVSSEGERLLCVSDTFLHPIHLEHPEWFAGVDLNPEKLLVTRRLLMDRAAAEKALVLAFHLPFPGLGHIVPKGQAWQWQPEVIHS